MGDIKKMKIALCLHGLFNSTTDTLSNGYDGFEYINKHILTNNQVDVFIHSWEIDKKNIIDDLFKPKKSIYENQKDFSYLIEERGLDKLENCPRSPQTVLSHLYSVTESLKLPYTINNFYDIIIKSRFDLGRINRMTSGPNFINPYPVQCINFTKSIEVGKIYMANWNHFHMGPADMWFYGDSEVMKKFTTLYKSLEDNFFIDGNFHNFATKIEGNRGDLSNAIAFYKFWMIENGLWDNKITLETLWE